jgi:hypothetical protein
MNVPNARGPPVGPVIRMTAFSASLNETHAIVGSCIDGITPANLIATLTLVLIGVGR